MLIYAFGSWAITTFNIALWVLTLAKRRLSPLAKAYFWWSFYITLWSFGYGITLCGWFSYETTLLWNKWCQAMAAMIAPYFFRFGCVVADDFERYRKLYRAYLIFAIVNAVGLFFTPYYVKGLWSFGVFHYQPLGGPLYIIFTGFFWWSTIHSFLVAAQKYKGTVGHKRAQLRLFLWGTGIAYSGGGELFLQGYRIPIPSYGVFPILAYVILIGYAVHKYRFLNVELILKRTVLFAGLVSVLFGFVTLSIYILQGLIASKTGFGQAVSVAITIAVAILFFHPLENALRRLTERFLFQKRYDYKELLKTFTDEVVTVLDLRRLVEMTVERLASTIKLEACALLLLNRERRRYEMAASRGLNDPALSVNEDEGLVALLRRTQEPLLRDTAEKMPDRVEERLDQLQTKVCLPLVLHDELIGLICLGKKKSDEEYTKDDLDILMPLAKTEAIAISNAQLVAEAAQKEKLAVIGTLAAAINHEVCNPLNNVKVQAAGFLIKLKKGVFDHLSKEELTQKFTELLQSNMVEVDRSAAITTRLSNFAKPAREPLSEAVNVEQAVNEVKALLGHDFELNMIRIQQEIPSDLPPIRADRKQIQEILFNLIRNAGQAIERNGTINVRARQSLNGRVQIEIQDTGCGIPEEHLGKLFTPFFTTKGEGQGTGLGLFVVKRLVERNDGTISANSGRGVGTTFTLEFPAHESALAHSAHR